MKYAIIIPDGAADEPQESLGGKTPIEGGAHAEHGPRRGDGRRCAGVSHAEGAAGRVGDRQPQPARLQPVREFHRPGADGSGRAGHQARPGRLGRPLQSGHDRRPDHARLHGRPCQHGGSDEAAGDVPGANRQRSEVSRRSWSSCRASAIAICCFGAARSCRRRFTNDTRTRAPHDITDQSVLEDHPRGPGSDVLDAN